MTGLPYIIDLFTGVLTTSKAIQGRFHVAYRYGAQEINSDQMGEILKDIINPGVKYPLAALIPPTSTGYLTMKDGWLRFHLIMCFMKTSFYDGLNQISNPNPKTGTSMHTVDQDIHDMMRCAINFGRRLDLIQRTPGKLFRMPKTLALFNSLCTVGQDRATGVKMHFDMEVYHDCGIEDYDDYDDTKLILSPDSHPQHLPL